jgi:hypothetical protein
MNIGRMEHGFVPALDPRSPRPGLNDEAVNDVTKRRQVIVVDTPVKCGIRIER